MDDLPQASPPSQGLDGIRWIAYYSRHINEVVVGLVAISLSSAFWHSGKRAAGTILASGLDRRYHNMMWAPINSK
jgi:hypothetical protein